MKIYKIATYDLSSFKVVKQKMPWGQEEYKVLEKIDGEWQNTSWNMSGVGSESEAFQRLEGFLSYSKPSFKPYPSDKVHDLEKYKISDFIKNNPRVEWVPIKELIQIREGNRELGNNDGLSSIVRDSPKVITTIEEDLLSGGELNEPLEIWYDGSNGELKLNEGNHRLAALIRLGWEYAPTIVFQAPLHGWGRYVAVKNPESLPHKTLFNIKPSQLGFSVL